MLVSAWTVDPFKILARRELACVLADLTRRAPPSAGQRMNKVISRLACCCGLRVSEIGALRLADVCVGTGRPLLRLGPARVPGREPLSDKPVVFGFGCVRAVGAEIVVAAFTG